MAVDQTNLFVRSVNGFSSSALVHCVICRIDVSHGGGRWHLHGRIGNMNEYVY